MIVQTNQCEEEKFLMGWILAWPCTSIAALVFLLPAFLVLCRYNESIICHYISWLPFFQNLNIRLSVWVCKFRCLMVKCMSSLCVWVSKRWLVRMMPLLVSSCHFTYNFYAPDIVDMLKVGHCISSFPLNWSTSWKLANCWSANIEFGVLSSLCMQLAALGAHFSLH